MAVFKKSCIFIIAIFLMFSCNSVRQNMQKPPVKMYDLILSKGIKK